MQREMDFSERNIRSRWFEVKDFWNLLEEEVKRLTKKHLERALIWEQRLRVGCGRYKRSKRRQGYRNGSYVRDLLSSYGWIEGLVVPRIREGGIDFQLLERYRRRQRQVDLVLLEAFLLGHSTRKTVRWFKRLFGGSISAQAVSNIVKELDQKVKEFHQRPLGDDYQFLVFDGIWFTLNKPVKTKKVLLVALGVKRDGTKEFLGFQLANSESESWWWGFLSDLKQRGLRGENLEVVVSDEAGGLVKALPALYPRIAHQICTFHKANDIGQHLVEKRHRRRIISDALYIFDGETGTEVRQRLRVFVDKWSYKEPKAVKNFIRGLENCLFYLLYPDPLRTMLKTNNLIERQLQELRRRTIPMRSFNNSRSIERIIYGLIAYVINQPQDMPQIEFTQLS